MAGEKGKPPFSLEGDSILGRAGLPEEHSQDQMGPEDVVDAEDAIESVEERPLFTWSGDELRERSDQIESELRIAFLVIPKKELAEYETVTDGLLSPSLWYKLQRPEQAALAEQYHAIEQELDRRKQDR